MTNMKIFGILILLFSYSCLADVTLIDKSRIPEILKTFKDGTPGTDEFNFQYKLSEKRNVDYTFSVSSKGNGAIFVPGVMLRIYDYHDDGSYFKGGLLLSSLVDLNNDGFTDIVLNGVAIITDEQTDEIVEELPVVSILMFDSVKNRYIVSLKSKYIDIFDEAE